MLINFPDFTCMPSIRLLTPNLVSDLHSKSVLKCTEAINRKKKERRLSLPAAALWQINPLSPELNPICYLLAILAHDFLHVSRISLALRLLMSYIYIYMTLVA
jgi:hypothetical protein